MSNILQYDVNRGHTQSRKSDMKKFCRGQFNVECYYCGTKYKKFDRCITDAHTMYHPCCQLCHIITNFSITYSKMIVICNSTKSQIEIINDTAKFIKVHNTMPTIIDIDKDATKKNIKPHVFFECFVKSDIGTQRSMMSTTKIFYTEHIDIASIIMRIIDNTHINDDDDFQNLSYTPSYNCVTPINPLSRDVIVAERLTRLVSKVNEQNKKTEQEIFLLNV